MSTLQISLAVIGVVLLALIVAYNAWTTHRNQPKKARPVEDDPRAEPALRQEPAFDAALGAPPVARGSTAPPRTPVASAAPGAPAPEELPGADFAPPDRTAQAAAPCTAMVFVWSRLCHGNPLFTLSQVALNDLIMVFAFAPLVAFLLGLSAITVPWDTLLVSVVLYIVLPVLLAQGWRRQLLAAGPEVFEAAISKMGAWSIIALLATLVLLFAFQGEAILRQPLVIALLAVPILIQVLFNAALAYGLNRAVGESHAVAGPSALIGASNFFELAVAAAISLFGFESGAALATVVGVLIEVPVMLLVVRVVNQSRGWYEVKQGVLR